VVTASRRAIASALETPSHSCMAPWPTRAT